MPTIKSISEKIIIIGGKKFYIWNDYYRGGTAFHQIPMDMIIPVRNANAPHMNTKSVKEVEKYIRKVSKKMHRK